MIMDKLPHEYDGLSDETECKIGEPDPLVPDGEYPQRQIIGEKVTVPEEANYTPKGSWKILVGILACAAPLVASFVLIFLKLTVPAAICAGVFAVAVTVFLVSIFAAEKHLLSGAGVLNKPDTRRVIARVTESVCTSRSYKELRDGYGRFYARELVSATYTITLKESAGEGEPQKFYTAKSKIYYAKGEQVAAYVRGKYAYIDDSDPFNAQKTSTRKR